MALVSRRGPDDAGFWTDGTTCLFGFRRLAVLDLSSTGHQPMTDAAGRFALILNGEIYNFRGLRHELELEGVRFRSTGDAEVVLHSLIRRGPDALHRFNGMFALAFFDSRTKQLLLARDHAGMKPLYWLLTRRGLVFGSQYDQILSHPWSAHLPVLPSSLALYLHFDHVPAPYALHDAVRMLEPGSWLTVGASGQTRTGRFFSFESEREPDLAGDAACEALEAVLTPVVRRHMVSDVPIGTYLSGGIDSPLIAAVMQAVAGEPLPAFTIATDGGITDEAADAAAYASEIGLDHTIRRIGPESVLSLLEDATRSCSEPFADFSILPSLLIASVARERVTVVLSGDGGDELFWGYVDRAVSVLEQVREFRSPRLWRVLRAALRGRHVPWEVLHLTIGDAFQAHQRFLPLRSLKRILPDLPDMPEDFTLFHYDGHDVDRTARWLRFVEFTLHLPRVLLKVDRASMFHSLEVRMPLLDREVVDLAAGIDWASCLDLRTGIGKHPLRRALARRVHHSTVAKRGFTVPMDDWIRGPLRAVIEDTLLNSNELLGLSLRRRALRSLWADHLRGRARHGWLFWRLLSLQLWSSSHSFARCRRPLP